MDRCRWRLGVDGTNTRAMEEAWRRKIGGVGRRASRSRRARYAEVEEGDDNVVEGGGGRREQRRACCCCVAVLWRPHEHSRLARSYTQWFSAPIGARNQCIAATHCRYVRTPLVYQVRSCRCTRNSRVRYVLLPNASLSTNDSRIVTSSFFPSSSSTSSPDPRCFILATERKMNR